MTIPTDVLAFARALDSLMSGVPRLHEALTAQSDQASGAEAIGMAALATELEQLSKVYRNYMPRIMKHVGEIDLLTQPKVPEFLKETSPPDDIVDIINWSAPPKERQAALLVKLNEVNGLIGLAEDRGGRAAAELYKKRDRIESGIRFNRATSVEAI